jgi:hypothetical protein
MNKKLKFMKVFTFVLVLMTSLLMATQASAVYHLRKSYAELTTATPLVAGEALAVGEVVCIKDTDGEVYKADANGSGITNAVGMAGTIAADGANVKVVIYGIFSGWSSLTEGAEGYLSETAGEITQTAPTSREQAIGYAISTTEYLLFCHETTANINVLGTITSDLTLDDGAGASPTFTLKDATDETAAFSKVDSSFLTITTAAADGVQVTTGNLKVGNQTPTTSQDGEDAYIEGTLEVDGALDFDGAADFASTITGAGNVTLDDGSGASPSLILKDATDETVTFSKVDAGYMTVTTVAGDGVQITTGNLRIGDGSEDATIDGEDLYCEGISEFDGAMRVDGALTTNSTITAVGNVTLDDGSGASPNLTLTDETNETAVFSKVDAGFLTVTTVAGDGVQVTTGNLKVGDGTPGVTQNGEDFYCEGTGEFAGDVTLDDGAGASPSFIMKDATDETMTISKVDSGFATVTTAAADGVQITTGNLKVGNGTPGVTQDGEDFYVEGTAEFVGTVTLDDGVTDSPSLIFKDATDETATFSKADGAYTSITTEAADGFQVLTGSLKVGNGTPVQTIDGEDAYIEGSLEVAGVIYAAGGIQFEGTDDTSETIIAATDATADRTITYPNWTGDVPVVISTDYADHAATNETADGTSVSVPDGVLITGTSLEFEVSGTESGGNATSDVILYIDDAAIITLSQGDNADTGDWVAKFVIVASGTATQRVYGWMIEAGEILYTCDVATDTTDFNDGSATTVKTQLTSDNVGDTITQKTCKVVFYP